MKDNILVTGGAGYIGSQFCKVASQYYNIIVYDNLSTGLKDFVKWGELVVGDLNDYDLLVNTFKKYNPIAVIHFAASIEVGESVLNPIKYYDNNVVNTLNLLKAMINCNIKNIIFSSSAAIFGLADTPILNENTIKNPLNAYGRSKYIVEQIFEDYKNSYDLNYTCLRYFNASGADPDCELGESHLPSNHLIPIIIDNYKNNKITKIFGGDWNTKDGSPVRDYIHVYDLATAHILALEKMLKNNKSININLGTGNGFSVLEIIKKVEEVLGEKVEYEIVGRRAGDAECSICDNKLAKEYLGWNIKYNDVKDHILHTWNWMTKMFYK